MLSAFIRFTVSSPHSRARTTQRTLRSTPSSSTRGGGLKASSTFRTGTPSASATSPARGASFLSRATGSTPMSQTSSETARGLS